MANYFHLFFQIISVISIAFVVVSTVGMTLNTIPSIQHRNANDEPIDNPKLALIEAICISWFTIEYLLRLAGTHFKKRTFKNQGFSNTFWPFIHNLGSEIHVIRLRYVRTPALFLPFFRNEATAAALIHLEFQARVTPF